MLDKLDELFPAQVGQPRQYKFRIIHAVPAFCFDTYPWQTYRIQAGTVAANQNEFPDVEQWVISIETNNIIPDNGCAECYSLEYPTYKSKSAN